MNSKTKMLCAFTVFLFLGSLAIGSVSAAYVVSGTVNNEQMIPAETYGDDRRNEAVNILMYIEHADLTVDEEYDHVMSSMLGSLEGKFTYENLTDYTQLGTMIEEFDVFLIVECEFLNHSTSDVIAAAWSSILPAFVESGGIVIGMGFEYYIADTGSSHNLLNASGLMELYNPENAYPRQMNVVEPNDALARHLPTTYTSSSGTLAYDTTDGTIVVEDNLTGKAVVVHKTMGKGHVVMLGFDMFSVEGNPDLLLRNAILLHRHIVFDNSHSQDYTIGAGFSTLADNIAYYGFSVSSSDIFSSAVLDACEIFVVSYCNTVYNTTEIEIIQNFVNGGGALLVVTEIGQYGDELDPLINAYGFARNTTNVIEDSDDHGITDWYVNFMPENIQTHSTKVGVDILEVYGSTGLITMPDGAVPLVTTDTDGTATWDGAEEANGVPVAAANLVGNGRIIIMCDNGFVSDDDFDSDGTVNFEDADNEVFTRNAFRWLSGAGIPEQTVVFDYSHSPYGYLHSNWQHLAKFLMFNGYNTIFTIDFEPAVYESADILVISETTSDYNTSELAQLTDYVSNGGALLLWADWQSWCEQTDPIAQEFGLHINATGHIDDTDDGVHDPAYIVYEGANLGAHPIMDGVDRIEIDLSNAFISIGAGTALVSTDSDGTSDWNDGSPADNLAVYAATTYNMGRVVYLSDIDLASLGDPDSDGFPNLYDSDNPVFLGNVFKWLAENRAPSVTVVTPNGGEVLNGTITVDWTAHDFDSDPLIYNVFYSDNNGSDWTLLESDLHDTEYEWNTTLHDDGTDYMIRVEVSDYQVGSFDDSDDPFELDNFVGGDGGPGGPIDTTLLIIIAAAGIVIVIVIIIIMKKKK